MHQIGVGVLGSVYRTYEPAADRLVAVKAFDLDITPEQIESFVESLNRLAGSDLSHSGIVAPIAAGLEGDTPYLAQEYVAAESLDIAVRHYAPASLDTVLPFITGIAEAVDAAHEHGIVHGTLHLRDIFVSPEEVRITGLGIANALEAIGLAVPIRRPYTAPEVVAGRAWGGEADLYAVAAVSYEILTGHRAAGSGDQMAKLLRDVVGVADHDALETAFVTALAEVPEERFSSGARFVLALRGALDEGQKTTVRSGAPMVNEVDDDQATDGTHHVDAVQEASLVPAGSAETLDLLAGLEFRQADPEVDAIESTVDDSAADEEASLAAEANEPTEPGVEDGPSDDQFDVVAVTDDASGPPDDYVPFAPRLTEQEVDDEGHLADNAWVSGDAVLVSSDVSGGNDGGYGDGGERESEGFVNAVEADQDYDDGVEDVGNDAIPHVADEQQTVPWIRRTVPFGLFLLVVAMVAFYVGGRVSDDAPGEQVLGQVGTTETVDTIGSGPGVALSGDETSVTELLAADEPVGSLANTLVDSTPEPAIPDEPVVADESVLTVTPTAPTEYGQSPPPVAEAVPPVPRLAAEGGWLLLRTEPPGATVLLDGYERGMTPLSLRDVPFGQHALEVHRDGFETATRLVDIQPDEPVVPIALELRSAPEGAIAERVATDLGSLVVESRPPGAIVLVDDEFVGVTPVAVPVPRGGHRVRMELDGYQVWSTTVEVAISERVRVAASLERTPR